MKNILISPSSFGQISPKPLELLRKHGFEVIGNPYGRKLSESEVINLGKNCVGIIAGVEALTDKVMDAIPTLRCISRVGVGMDNIDLEYAKTKGITVVNTPKGPTQAVAELALGLTLSLLRLIPQANADMKRRIWKKHTGNLLLGKVIGVIGLGSIGRKVAELFCALDNRVIGFDPKPEKEWLCKNNVELMSFDELLAESDVILLHIPGNSDNSAIIGRHEIDKLRDGAFLINLARGGVVDEQALYNALVARKINAAAIDVFSVEPYDGPLCDLENVILTPHLGSYAKEGKLNMEIDAVQNIINALGNAY